MEYTRTEIWLGRTVLVLVGGLAGLLIAWGVTSIFGEWGRAIFTLLLVALLIWTIHRRAKS